MLESSLEFIKCVNCSSKLELNSFKDDGEIVEGLLECAKCHLQSPIIKGIPILWSDFSLYLSSRKRLGGQLYRMIENVTLKKFCKDSLSKTPQTDDRTSLEERWSTVYQNNRSLKFYSEMKRNLDTVKKSDLVLEYGCSVGIMTIFLAESHRMVFGVDRSFHAIRTAKRSPRDNLDYFVADFMSCIFGGLQFDLVLALNVLELVEPLNFLRHVTRQITGGHFVISDPYDFERGANSVKRPLDETSLRQNLRDLGFQITEKTKNPAFIPWNLRLSPRTVLNYDVDLIIGKKDPIM